MNEKLNVIWIERYTAEQLAQSVTLNLNIKTGMGECVRNVVGGTGEQTMKTTEIYIYGARDTSTGKLVSDITNPPRKYWDRKGNAVSAIEYYNRTYANKKLNSWINKGEHGTIELVTFKLVEVEDEQRD